MELDFDKYCIIDGSPTTVLPAPRIRINSANRKSNADSNYRNNPTSVSKDCMEKNNLHHYRSASCRDVRLRRSSELLNRGSVYKSSKEVDRQHDVSERKKIEFSGGIVSEISSNIIDSLCSSDEDNSVVERKRSSVMYESEQSTSSPSCKNQMEFSKSKVRFNLPKKMLNPFVRSEYRISPGQRMGCGSTPNEDMFSKSNDLSEQLYPDAESSPGHIRGVLRVANKCGGVRNYEFSVKSPEDVYVTKAWKVVENSLTRVYYTVHSLHQRRKSNAIGRGSKHSHRESTLVGQMNVSSRYLCTEEAKSDGSPNESMVTEFGLYDVHDENSSPSSCKPVKSKLNVQLKPQPSSEMDPGQEIAAIVIKVPSEKRDSLTFNSGMIHVVIPDGTHGGGRCSPLLDRWRLGGGCDCGGWDVACPLSVFASSNFHMNDQNRYQIFALGKKDKSASFIMKKMIEDDKYAVDFHVKLSSLQAFSICIAILHCADASSASLVRREQILRNKPLRSSVVDALSGGGKFTKAKKMNEEEILPPFVVHPPFSPLARA